MSYRTLTELEADIRYQFDLEGFTARHPQAQVFRLVNESVRQMRKLVTEMGSSQYLATVAGTVGPGATSGYHGSIVAVAGGASIEMVRDVQAQGNNGEWYRLPELTIANETVDGESDAQTGIPEAWILRGWDVETSGSASAQSRQVMVIPPSNSTYNLRLVVLKTWTDAISTDRIMADSMNLEWVKWHVGVKLAERDEDAAALQRRGAALVKIEEDMRTRCAKEGSPVRSRIAFKRRGVRQW